MDGLQVEELDQCLKRPCFPFIHLLGRPVGRYAGSNKISDPEQATM